MPFLIIAPRMDWYFKNPSFIDGNTEWTDNITEAQLFSDEPEYIVQMIVEDNELRQDAMVICWIDSTKKNRWRQPPAP